MPGKRGGPQPGSGRPKGSLNKATIAEHELKRINAALIREAAAPYLARIAAAHAENALGVSYLVLRDASGAYVRATDEKQVDIALQLLAAGDDRAARIYTKEPHAPSASLLYAYAAGKPIESVELTGAEGGPLVVKWQG